MSGWIEPPPQGTIAGTARAIRQVSTDLSASSQILVSTAQIGLCTVPGQEISYTEFRSQVTTQGKTDDFNAIDVLSSIPFRYDGSACIFSFFAPYATTGASTNSELIGVLKEDAAPVERIFRKSQGAATSTSDVIYLEWAYTPSPGLHEYRVSIYMSGADGSLTAGHGVAGQFEPGYLHIRRGESLVGP